MPACEKVHSSPDIYCIKVPIEGSPYKFVNSYLVTSNGETLIVDTGYDRPECREVILAALSELNCDLDKTSLFVTHFHNDHAGGFKTLLPASCPRFAGKREVDFFSAWIKLGYEEGILERFAMGGLPQDTYGKLHPGIWITFVDDEMEQLITPLDEYEAIQVGCYKFRCVVTPGHTPGHTILFEDSSGVAILGDSILHEISPSLAPWPFVANALGGFIDSMRTLCALDIKTALMGHFDIKPANLIQPRATELLMHQYNRLHDFVQIIAEHPNINAFEICQAIRWRGGKFEFSQLNQDQQYYAFAQSIVHLDFLCEKNIIMQHEQDGFVRYNITK